MKRHRKTKKRPLARKWFIEELETRQLLAIDLEALELTAPQTLMAGNGDIATISWTVRNNGDEPINGHFDGL